MRKKVKYFGSICKNCPYDSDSFQNIYFTSANCCARSKDKDKIGKQCVCLKNNLNYDVQKGCVKVDIGENIPFNMISIDKFFCPCFYDIFVQLFEQHSLMTNSGRMF